MGTSGTLCIRVPGRTVRWYNRWDSYPENWAYYIVAELRMLLLLYSIPDIVSLVHNLRPIDYSQPPSAEQLAAFRRIAPTPQADPPDGLMIPRPLWYHLLLTVSKSLLSTLTVGWYAEYDIDQEFDYVIDFTSADGRGSFSMRASGLETQYLGGQGQNEAAPTGADRQVMVAINGWKQEVRWEGVDSLPADIVQQMIVARQRRRQQEEVQDEKQAEADRHAEAAARARKEEADKLYDDKQSASRTRTHMQPHSTRTGVHCPPCLHPATLVTTWCAVQVRGSSDSLQPSHQALSGHCCHHSPAIHFALLRGCCVPPRQLPCTTACWRRLSGGKPVPPVDRHSAVHQSAVHSGMYARDAGHDAAGPAGSQSGSGAGGEADGSR